MSSTKLKTPPNLLTNNNFSLHQKITQKILGILTWNRNEGRLERVSFLLLHALLKYLRLSSLKTLSFNGNMLLEIFYRKRAIGET